MSIVDIINIITIMIIISIIIIMIMIACRRAGSSPGPRRPSLQRRRRQIEDK